MKKFLSSFMIALLLIGAIPLHHVKVSASSENLLSETESYRYKISDNEATIIGYNYSDENGIVLPMVNGKITIPSTLGGYPVTKIDVDITIPEIGAYCGAFEECTSITDVIIPDGVRSIGKNSFAGCSQLKSITIPSTIAHIEERAFGSCYSLTDVYYNGTESQYNSMVIESGNKCLTSANVHFSLEESNPEDFQYVVKNGKVIITGYRGDSEDVVIPSNIDGYSVSEIGEAFINCNNIKSVVIPDGVTSISDNAFRYCSNLLSVIIPDSVSSIGAYVFYDCTNLTNIILPNNAVRIGYHSFENTEYYNNFSNWDNEVLYIGNHLIDTKESLYDSYTIKSGTKTIADDAFFSCRDLTNIIIPDSVIHIGAGAFSGCSNLSSVTIPDSVISIGNAAFYECDNLTTISLPNSITSVGYNTFHGCDSIESITIPNSVNSIETWAFYQCYSLREIIIPDSVTKIGQDAFKNTALYNDLLNWENDVLYIGNCLIEAKESLSGLYTIKPGTKIIADYAFNNCKSITNVSIPESVINIGDNAFSGCESLTSVIVPDSVVTLGQMVFAQCESLKNAVVGKNVTSIDDYAFYDCVSLESITLPFIGSSRNAADSYDAVFGYIFGYSTWDNGNGTYQYRDNYSRYYYYIPPRLKTVVITNTNQMPCNAFYNCSNIATLVILGNVTDIGVSAFYNCTDIKDVYYIGSEEDWLNISIGEENECFINAQVHYNITEEILSCSIIGHIGGNATCENKAICTRCNQEYGILLRHTWESATCTEPQKCLMCGTTSGLALGHNYDLGKVTKEATCKDTGVKTYTCDKCGATKTETIAKVVHSYNAATCTKAKTCKVCGTTTGSKLSHQSDTGTVTKKATCTATGTKTYKCTLCKATIKTDTIAKVAHKYDSGKVTKAATCKATGVKTYTCSVCKGTKTETIAKSTTHTYSNNCDKSCNVCGKTRTVGAHNYSNSCDTTCNYCNAKRSIKHTYTNNCDTSCNVCKATRSITHAYKTTTTKATLTKNGSIVKKCTVCGKVASNTAIKYARTFKLSTTAYTYNGAVKTPSVTVKDSAGKTLKKNTDYTVTYASGRKNAGTYKVTIKMIGKYSGTRTLTFKINPAKLSSYKLSATAYTYNGKVKTPSVTVKNANGTKLTKNTHYTVTYASGRKNVGTYKVTIKGKGNYTGTKTLYFTIKPKAASVNTLTAKSKALTVKLNRSLQQSTGYQIQYSTGKSFKSYKTKTLTSYKTSTTTLTGLKAKTTYYVRVRTYKTIGKTKYYSGWSTYKYVKTK